MSLSIVTRVPTNTTESKSYNSATSSVNWMFLEGQCIVRSSRNLASIEPEHIAVFIWVGGSTN